MTSSDAFHLAVIGEPASYAVVKIGGCTSSSNPNCCPQLQCTAAFNEFPCSTIGVTPTKWNWNYPYPDDGGINVQYLYTNANGGQSLGKTEANNCCSHR
jgi:heme/copper-type cytochrome/quinol oxidase subunit 2